MQAHESEQAVEQKSGLLVSVLQDGSRQRGIAVVWYLNNSSAICGGDVLEPIICLIGCFLLVTVGISSLLALVRTMNRSPGLPVVMLGVTLFAAAIPGVFVSGAWLSCSLSAPPDLASAMTLEKASLRPRFRIG